MICSDIPLIRAAVCECFIGAAQSSGAPVERYARDSRLSINALEDPKALVPQIPAWRFIERVTKKEGDALFGVRMNHFLAAQNIKTIYPFLANSANALILLKKFCSSVRLQTNVANFTVEEASDFLWVYTNQIRPSHAADHVELFQLTGIISVIQAALGSSWRPLLIDFQFNKPRIEIAHSPDLNPSQHRFGRPRGGIAIGRVELSTPLNPANNLEHPPVSIREIEEIPGNLKDQIFIAMGAMLSERVPTVARIEDITDTSLRALQRKLQQEGTSFRLLLEQARMQRAHDLLTRTDIAVAEISRMLGYSNPPAFNRSFRRWSAITPKVYRQVWGARKVS